MKLHLSILPAAVLLLPSTAFAQTITAVVSEGDAVTGVGLVTFINNLDVNNAGLWIVEADTDAATTADLVVLRNGPLYLRELDPLAPPPATFSSNDGFILNNNGDIGWNIFLDGLTTTTDSGVYFNQVLVIQEGTISGAPQFSANTPYIGWFEARLNDNNQILMVASVDDPVIASTVDRALVLATVNGAGALLSEAVLLKEGDTVPGFGADLVVEISTGVHDSAFNNLGNSIFSVDMNTVTTTNDGAIVISSPGLTVVAREGDPSAVAGRNWGTLISSAVDMNDSGDWVNIADLDGATTDDLLIVKNGTTVIAQEGSGLPAIGAFTFTSFGTGAVRIDNGGNVFWYGDWNDTVLTQDTGIFRNDQLIVQEGVTMVGGVPIESISSGQDNFAISDDGRYLIFEGNLPGADNTVFLVDFGPSGPAPVPYCFGDGSGTACPCGNAGAPGNGCANSINPSGANLAVSGSSSLAADSLVLTGSGTAATAPGLFFQGTTQVNAGSGATFGDGLRCAGGTVVRLKSVPANASGISMYPGPGDPSVSVRGMVLAAGVRHYQLWYRNAAAFCTPDTFNLTNGVTVTWVP